MALTLDATSAGMRPILIKRARATSLPAFVSVRYQVELREKPGCDGVATRLPKDPGVQKLSPLSSAQAGGAAKASAAAMAPPARRCGHARCRAVDPSHSISPPTPARPRRRPPWRPPTIRTASRTSAAGEHDHGLGTKNVGDCCRSETVERDDLSSSRHPALASCRSMIFSENRYPLFGIMLARGDRRSARARTADHLAGALAPLAAERPRLDRTGRDDGARIRLGGTGIRLGRARVGLYDAEREATALDGGRGNVRRQLGSDIPLRLGGGIGLHLGGDIRRHLRDRIRTDIGPATRERRNDGRTQRQGRKARCNFVPRHLMTPTQPPPWRLRARWGLRGISRGQAAKGSPGADNYPQPWKRSPFQGENRRPAWRRRPKRPKSPAQTIGCKNPAKRRGLITVGMDIGMQPA